MDMDDVEMLKGKRAELERQIAELEGSQGPLYTPGITIVPQDGAAPTGVDQQLEQLRAAILEIDTKIATVAEHGTD